MCRRAPDDWSNNTLPHPRILRNPQNSSRRKYPVRCTRGRRGCPGRSSAAGDRETDTHQGVGGGSSSNHAKFPCPAKQQEARKNRRGSLLSPAIRPTRFGEDPSIIAASRSTADGGNSPQSAFPKPQLMPSRIMARGVGSAASIKRRISSAANNFGPCSARLRRSTFFDGSLNPGPKRTGRSISPVSRACLNRQRVY